MGALRTEQGQQLRDAEVERARCAWLIAADLASKAVGADVRVVMQTRGTAGRGGTEKTSRARKIACYLATTVANVTQARLSDATGIDRSTIFQHAGWVEDQRDDVGFDTMIDRLERTLLGMAVKVVIARLGDVAVDLGLVS